MRYRTALRPVRRSVSEPDRRTTILELESLRNRRRDNLLAQSSTHDDATQRPSLRSHEVRTIIRPFAMRVMELTLNRHLG